MENPTPFPSSNSRSSGANLLLDDMRGADGGSRGLASAQSDLENLSVSRRLARNLSYKLKKKKNKCAERLEDVKCHGGMAFSSGCLSFHVKGSGCRVESCEDFDCKPGRRIVENAISIPEKLWRKGCRNDKGTEVSSSSSAPIISLPDDVLEMVLAMLPWTSLMSAGNVCRKWRSVISTAHFMQRRSECSYKRPCLFLFGVTSRGFNIGEIHALDISLDQWRRCSHFELSERILFSVASIGIDVFIVGGCCYLSYTSSRGLKRPLKEVFVFNPIKNSFHEAAPMKEERSEPVLGVFEVSPLCNIFQSQVQLYNQFPPKARAFGQSDVYEDPHRFSLRRQLRDGCCSSEGLHPIGNSFISRKIKSHFAMIVVGGHGSFNEPLDSGEIYDPITNRWVEIARLPKAFGPVCSGTVCNTMFYVYSEEDKLARFDLEKGHWTMIQVSHPPIHLSDYYPKLVSCKNRLFLLCVSWYVNLQVTSRLTASRNMWELDLTYQTWIEVSRHPDAPMDCNALFVADQDRIYGLEMFRIFGQVLDFVAACNVSDGEFKWDSVSRKHAAHDADASSCITKSMLVMYL